MSINWHGKQTWRSNTNMSNTIQLSTVGDNNTGLSLAHTPEIHINALYNKKFPEKTIYIYRQRERAPLTCDLEPEMPSSTTSSTAVRHCLSCIRWSCSVSHRIKQWNAAQIIEWRSLEWAGAGRLHWYMMNSQIQLIVRLHMRMFGAVTLTLARPERTSIAARATFMSIFQEAIRRLQTRDVAWPKTSYAESGRKTWWLLIGIMQQQRTTLG